MIELAHNFAIFFGILSGITGLASFVCWMSYGDRDYCYTSIQNVRIPAYVTAAAVTFGVVCTILASV